MSDLISRQAAIDALDGKIEITGRTNAEAVKGYVRLVKDRLERLPSTQPEVLAHGEGELSAQTEIILCKDCKHRHLDGMIWNCPFGLSGGEDFFCAYGAKDGDSNDE